MSFILNVLSYGLEVIGFVIDGKECVDVCKECLSSVDVVGCFFVLNVLFVSL